MDNSNSLPFTPASNCPEGFGGVLSRTEHLPRANSKSTNPQSKLVQSLDKVNKASIIVPPTSLPPSAGRGYNAYTTIYNPLDTPNTLVHVTQQGAS